jgi:hypothetical protein
VIFNFNTSFHTLHSPKSVDKELSLNWGREGVLLIDFCRLLLAIDRAIKRAMSDKKIGFHVELN